MTYRRRYFATLSVPTSSIQEKAITEDKLADSAVTSPKIKDADVQSADIADGAIRLRHLGPDVPAIGIVDGSITTPKLANEAVTREKINDQAINSLKIADNAVTTSKFVDGAVTPAKLSAIDSPADGEVPAYNAAQLKFEWKPAAGVSRPLVPPIATAEIGDAQVTPAKLSFTPVSRPLTPPATPAEMEDRFTLNSNLLVFSNLSGASVPNTEIDLTPYVPAGTKYAVVVMTHAGANTIQFGYKAQFYVLPTGAPAPLYRLDTAQKDFTNYLTVLVPLDSNRKFLTSVYRDGVTTAAELYLMGYIR